MCTWKRILWHNPENRNIHQKRFSMKLKSKHLSHLKVLHLNGKCCATLKTAWCQISKQNNLLPIFKALITFTFHHSMLCFGYLCICVPTKTQALYSSIIIQRESLLMKWFFTAMNMAFPSIEPFVRCLDLLYLNKFQCVKID